MAEKKTLIPLDENTRHGGHFVAKSGLKVEISQDIWVILPNNGKGREMKVGWARSAAISPRDQDLIFMVLIYYARTKAASTAEGVVTNIKPYVAEGIPSLYKIKNVWSGLKTNNKKGLNQFFGTLSKLGYDEYDIYHEYTSSHLDKDKKNTLDLDKGALTDFEFDSVAKQVNQSLREFDWEIDRGLDFYRSDRLFGKIRNKVTAKLLLAIVRRPIQLTVLKWSDLIPAGASYKDSGINSLDEIGTVGASTLQLRVFIAKASGGRDTRDFPERYPIHLSEDLSTLMHRYKRLYCRGVELLFRDQKIAVGLSDLLAVIDNMPIFPDCGVFSLQYSLEMFRLAFTQRSMAFHNSESSIAQSFRYVKVESDRVSDCVVSSNRVRHTVLTRGAQDGLPAVQLARLTGVTVPAARHYIDLDYTSRRMIDSSYIGNAFLKEAFSSAITEISSEDDPIVDSHFNPVGSPRNSSNCTTCTTNMGRPLGCYGCPNFRPLLEADHRNVLAAAKDKLIINQRSLVNPLHTRSIEKLERQIAWVQLTIDACDETLLRERAINA
ncbi:hypothetical protein [Pseudomonas syringae]|uniref:hypothetical protein n=1 Tax=Pseudomonas syringae TaxID=317 RepID=UPI000CDB87F2|nr:hypothetical protein [Pseudomonas syringae]POP71884.1 hypothetical protein CXB35_04080 [Pseudomonas syringae]